MGWLVCSHANGRELKVKANAKVKKNRSQLKRRLLLKKSRGRYGVLKAIV